MRKSTYIQILITAIIICVIALCILCRLDGKEGFFDMATDYNALRTRLSTMMAAYCDLASYAQEQMKIIYMTPKPLGLGKTETSKEADAHVLKTYADVYGCKDEYASSRATCSSGGISDTDFVSCDTYMKLPDLTDTNTSDVAIALRKIPDNLALRITREVDWYAQIVKKLTEALAQGMNPPGVVSDDKEIPIPPDSENSPATDSSGKPWALKGFSRETFIDYSIPQNKAWLVEGFDASSTCSASQAQAQIEQKKAATASAAASSCTMPTPDTEIPRVNAILDSSDLQTALAKCAALKVAMEKLKEYQQKAKDGNLFPWQKDGPKKTFVTLPAGNRIDGLLSSLKQNQL